MGVEREQTLIEIMGVEEDALAAKMATSLATVFPTTPAETLKVVGKRIATWGTRRHAQLLDESLPVSLTGEHLRELFNHPLWILFQTYAGVTETVKTEMIAVVEKETKNFSTKRRNLDIRMPGFPKRRRH